LMTARLGLRISDLRQLELGDLDWRAKTITIVQHKTGRPLSLPLLDDGSWAVIHHPPPRPPPTPRPPGFLQHPPPPHPFWGAPSSLRRLRARLVGRLPPVAPRCPRGIRLPARPGVRDAFPAWRAGRRHDRQRRADAGDISGAGTRLQRHDPGLLPALRHRTAA